MSAWHPDQNNSSDSEDEENTFDIKGREAIIFVLDALLFESSTNFQEAAKLIQDALLSGLMVNDKDLIGIVFANTKESPAPKDAASLKNIVIPPNCTLFLPLRQLNKDIVEYYLKFIEENYFNFKTTYGVNHGKFANMIRLCGNMFQQCGMKLSNQTIVYFTDREMPHEAGSQDFQKAIQRATNLEGQNIEFSLIPMRDDFDFQPFYKEFLSLVNNIDMDSFEPTDPKLAREMIADRKLKLDINKRCLGHVNWNLGKDLELSVKFYNYFQKSVYPKKVNLQRDDNSIVTVKMATYIEEKDTETGDVVSRRELRAEDEVYEIPCSSTQRIQVQEHEMHKIRYPYQPILQLIGFKDRSAFKKQHYFKPCSFIYPDDGRIAGSTKLFTALWQQCLAKEKVAVCIFIPRKKSKPSYVALVPVMSDNNETNMPTFMNADGFKVVYLPVAEDLHHFDLKDWDIDVTSSEDGQALFKKIMKKLKGKYIPSNIKDPALEELQSRLLALAFNITTEGGGEMPNVAKQDERIEQYFGELDDIFGAEEIVEKRKADSPIKSSSVKVPKLSILSAPMVDTLIAAGKLESLNKEQITGFLKQNDVKVLRSMSKAVLITKLLELRNAA